MLRSKKYYLAAVLLSLLVVLIYLPILWRMPVGRDLDYMKHFRCALEMQNSHRITGPHFLYHIIIIFCNKFFSMLFHKNPSFHTLYFSGFGVLLFCNVLTGQIIFYLFTKTQKMSLALSTATTLGILLAGPIIILISSDRHFSSGFIVLNVYHNPTIFVLKPIAISLFFAVSNNLHSSDRRANGKTLIFCFFMTILSALAKPNFIICFIPALTVFWGCMALRGKNVNWKLLCLGVVIPSLIVLSFQYYITYTSAQIFGSSQEESGIILAPFEVMKLCSSWLVPKFFLSVAFPLVVFCTHTRTSIRDNRVIVAWLAFIFGAFYTYFLAESGPRFYHGNFGWSSQITLFILFIVSALFLFEQRRNTGCGKLFGFTSRTVFCLIVFFLHILYGIVSYATVICKLYNIL